MRNPGERPRADGQAGLRVGAAMARVFVSHASQDGRAAADVHQWLRADGHEVFLDQDRNDGIALGEDWERRLYEHLRSADAVVCIVTPSYVASAWCFAEVALARSIGSLLLPLMVEPGSEHPLLRPVQHANYADDPARARAELS